MEKSSDRTRKAPSRDTRSEKIKRGNLRRRAALSNSPPGLCISDQLSVKYETRFNEIPLLEESNFCTTEKREGKVE